MADKPIEKKQPPAIPPGYPTSNPNGKGYPTTGPGNRFCEAHGAGTVCV
jgi:hypothetical protein